MFECRITNAHSIYRMCLCVWCIKCSTWCLLYQVVLLLSLWFLHPKTRAELLQSGASMMTCPARASGRLLWHHASRHWLTSALSLIKDRREKKTLPYGVHQPDVQNSLLAAAPTSVHVYRLQCPKPHKQCIRDHWTGSAGFGRVRWFRLESRPLV